jgi:hypothetical protein
MPDRSVMEKLLDRAPLALVVVGSVLLVIGAAGGLPIGSQPLQVIEDIWRIVLGVVGCTLAFVGMVLLILEGKSKGKVRRFDRTEDAVRYILKRMREANKSICDLTWEKPYKTPLTYTEMEQDDYLSVIKEVSHRIRYREIIMFCGSEIRIKKVEQLVQKAGKHYQLAGYADLPKEAPPRRHFVIIDDEEVISHNLAIKQPDIVDYYRQYYDALWVAATPIKIGDMEPNLELLELAKKTQEEARMPPPTPSRQAQIVFQDQFDEFNAWKSYLEGNVYQSEEVSYTGPFSLKKESRQGKGDPYGGYREIGKIIGRGYVFSGWIYRPDIRTNGNGDRLAIENSSFNGYGFTVGHYINLAWIELREHGKKPTRLSPQVPCVPPRGQWYQFEFYVRTNGELALRLCDHAGNEFCKIQNVVDKTYTSFDRATVHGGFPYYVDNLRIEVL